MKIIKKNRQGKTPVICLVVSPDRTVYAEEGENGYSLSEECPDLLSDNYEEVGENEREALRHQLLNDREYHALPLMFDGAYGKSMKLYWFKNGECKMLLDKFPPRWGKVCEVYEQAVHQFQCEGFIQGREDDRDRFRKFFLDMFKGIRDVDPECGVWQPLRVSRDSVLLKDNATGEVFHLLLANR